MRVHRAGEKAPYTGLKPAGRDLGPAIPAADKALETGSEAALTHLLTGGVPYIHFVERLYEATHAASGGHYEEHPSPIFPPKWRTGLSRSGFRPGRTEIPSAERGRLMERLASWTHSGGLGANLDWWSRRAPCGLQSIPTSRCGS